MATAPDRPNSAALLHLPPPKHPRRANRVASMGETMLMAMRSRGENIPANVETLRPAGRAPVNRTPELALALAIWATLDDAHRARVRFQIDAGAASGTPEFVAVADLLDGRV